MYGGVVLGAGTVAAGAIVLPNTGGNRLLDIVASATLIAGLAILATTVARIVAKKAYKA